MFTLFKQMVVNRWGVMGHHDSAPSLSQHELCYKQGVSKQRIWISRLQWFVWFAGMWGCSEVLAGSPSAEMLPNGCAITISGGNLETTLPYQFRGNDKVATHSIPASSTVKYHSFATCDVSYGSCNINTKPDDISFLKYHILSTDGSGGSCTGGKPGRLEDTATAFEPSSNGDYTITLSTGGSTAGACYYTYDLNISNGVYTRTNAIKLDSPPAKMVDFCGPIQPKTTYFSPAHNTNTVAINTELTLVFNKLMEKGTGDIRLHPVGVNNNASDIVLNVSDQAVSINNNVVKLALSSPLAWETQYAVYIPNTAFIDSDNIAFAGFSDDTSWAFTTAARPALTGIDAPTDGPYTIGDTMVVTLHATQSGLTLNTGTINGVSVTNFTENGNKTYLVTYTVANGQTDRAASDDIPVNFILQDADGNTTLPYTTAISQSGDRIDANNPSINSVTIPNVSMKLGDEVTATITVASDADDYSSGSGGVNGTIAGFSIGNLSRTDNTTYTATFTVAASGSDIAASANIPVDIKLTDSAGNQSSAFTSAITQHADLLDVTLPTLNPVSIASTNSNNTVATTGDTVTLSFTASEPLSAIPTVTIAGRAATVSSTSANNYTASYTLSSSDSPGVITFGVDFTDSAGNAGTQVTTTTDSSAVTLDNVAPTINAVSIPNTTMKLGDEVTATITVASDTDDYTTGSGSISGTIAGFSVENLRRTDNTTYTATFMVTVAGSDIAANADIPVNIQLSDSIGNLSMAYTSAISQHADVLDTTQPVLQEITPVSSLIRDITPAYTFSSSEAGTLSVTGSCNTVTTAVTQGSNTIHFSHLSAGTYNDCALSVADVAGNSSAPLPITAFTVESFVAMAVKGGSTPILIKSGDTSPRVLDGTDFGNNSTSQTFTIHNTGSIPLSLTNTPTVQLLKDEQNAFSIARSGNDQIHPDNTSEVAVGGILTFSIDFALQQGLGSATVVIASNDTKSPYTFKIQGASQGAATQVAPRVDKLRAFLASDNTEQALQAFQNSGGAIRFAADLVDSDGGNYTYTWSSNHADLQGLLTSLDATLQDGTLRSGNLAISSLAAGRYPLTLEVTDSTFSDVNYRAKAEYVLDVVTTPVNYDDSNRDDDGDGISNDRDTNPDSAQKVAADLEGTTNYLSEVEMGYSLTLGTTAKSANRASVKVTSEELADHGDEGGTASNTELTSKTLEHIFDYVVEGVTVSDSTTGEKVRLILPLEAPLASNSTFHKYSADGGWSNFVEDADNIIEWAKWVSGQTGQCPAVDSTDYSNATSREGGNCLRVTLQDGGPNDQDGKVNGQIVDPLGIATPNPQPPSYDDKPPIIINQGDFVVTEGTSYITKIDAVDFTRDTLRYHLIVGAVENVLFRIDANSGELRLKQVPDYENPHDADRDNVYHVEVAASDQRHTTTQTFAVHVTDLRGEADTITNPPQGQDNGDSSSNTENTDSNNTSNSTGSNGGNTPPASEDIVSRECRSGIEGIAAQYVAFFNRAPDTDGLQYWFDSGLSLEAIGASFFYQPETQAAYPAGTSNSTFLTQVYNNLFGRNPDPAGLAYWIAELDNGRVYREQTILAFISGAQTNDKALLDNKTAVGCYFAAQNPTGNAALAQKVMENVTADKESFNQQREWLEQFK